MPKTMPHHPTHTPAPTNFFDQVYDVVCQVPEGQVATYGQIAAVLGLPRGARAVGWALRALSAEQAEYIPWWRIINAQGRISTTYREHSAAIQRDLLVREGIPFGANDTIPLDQVRWPVTSPGALQLWTLSDED